MDGAILAPVAGVRLRRFLLVAALGLAGWLLSVLFAAAATAAPHDPVTDPPAAEEPAAEAPAEEPVAEEPVGEAPTEEAPAEEIPEYVSEPGSSSGSASTEAEPEAEAEFAVMAAPAPEPEPAVEPEPEPEPQPSPRPSSGGGLLGGLLGVVTNLVGGVLDTTGSILAPVVDPPSEPIFDVPELLPADDGWTWGGGSSSGSAETVRAEPVVAPVTAATVAPVAPVVSAPVATEAVVHHQPRFIAEPVAPRQPSLPAPEPNDADQAQHGSGGDRLPGKVPAAPAAPAGPTASAGHDHSGGARGLHGVLVAHTTLEPGDAGFTTRSRAVNAAGRAAGLPAATPD